MELRREPPSSAPQLGSTPRLSAASSATADGSSPARYLANRLPHDHARPRSAPLCTPSSTPHVQHGPRRPRLALLLLLINDRSPAQGPPRRPDPPRDTAPQAALGLVGRRRALAPPSSLPHPPRTADPPPAPLADAQQLVARRFPRRLPRRQVRRRRGDVPALQGRFHKGALPSPSSGRAGGC